MAVAASPAAFPTTEGRIRALVEAELAAELARRDRTRLHVEDQQWVYELVGRVVGEEQRQASAPVTVDESELLWRPVFAAVTPLGPLAEHLADPDVEEVRINGTQSCFVFRHGCRESVPPPFDNEDALIDLVPWYTDGAGGAADERDHPQAPGRSIPQPRVSRAVRIPAARAHPLPRGCHRGAAQYS